METGFNIEEDLLASVTKVWTHAGFRAGLIQRFTDALEILVSFPSFLIVKLHPEADFSQGGRMPWQF